MTPAIIMKAWQSPGVTTTLEASLTLNPHALAPTPSTLSTNELLISVISAALNPVDITIAELGLLSRLAHRGAYSPGVDFCGRVVAAHATALASHPEFEAGALVFGALSFPPLPKHGSLGQLMVATTASCVPVPAGVAPDDAAAVASVGSTALSALAGVAPGAKVLINGGSGGVGTAAIQIAKALGAVHVTATCSAANIELCRRLGADDVLDYRSVDVVETLKRKGEVYDLIVDVVGNPELKLYENSGAYLKERASYVQVGMPVSMVGIRSLARRALTPRCSGGGQRSFQFLKAKIDAEHLRRVGELVQDGKLQAVIDKTFQMDDVPQAFEMLRQGRTKGKIVIHVAE
ncbi:putative secondary metabolism biosynthetic enzyme [Neofusicoccum ribis]|uniref:Secondary metabolism biosynthetic enzyme n=1 Tax=Neofusicoccum ribis TaxID=45134 RepID=A0ABR3SJD3_9PEZI